MAVLREIVCLEGIILTPPPKAVPLAVTAMTLSPEGVHLMAMVEMPKLYPDFWERIQYKWGQLQGERGKAPLFLVERF